MKLKDYFTPYKRIRELEMENAGALWEANWWKKHYNWELEREEREEKDGE